MAGILRLRSAGPDVRQLQQALASAGARMVADGVFGRSTGTAVRLFQRRHALLPDGIAGPATMAALAAVPPRQATPASPGRRTSGPPPSQAPSFGGIGVSLAALAVKVGPEIIPWAMEALHGLAYMMVSHPVAGMSMSAVGTEFLRQLECQNGKSEHLHFPGGNSGVTIGPGYDMGNRSAATIKADLTAIGVPATAADAASKGAGKTGAPDAAKFAAANRGLFKLTGDQETALLRRILPSYEDIVRRNVSVDLMQHEFDALTMFAYNPGGDFTKVSDAINQGRVAAAMAEIRSRVHFHGVVVGGLVARRAAEVSVYFYGKYVRK